VTTSDPVRSIAIVGAGPGIGASVARRFARAGYAVGLIARNADRLDRMAAEIGRETGARLATRTADVTVPAEVRHALAAVSADLGDPSALCFSPIPDIRLIRPVLETRAEEFAASLQLNVAGAAVAVETVLPAMRAGNGGSLLFTTRQRGAAAEPATRRQRGDHDSSDHVHRAPA
jgi:short-subunit dehydrogenase